MPDENKKILKYVPGEKALKAPFIIYADLESLLHKTNICSNNPDKSYTEKKAVHKPSGYSLHASHLINQKMKENIIEEKTV